MIQVRNCRARKENMSRQDGDSHTSTQDAESVVQQQKSTCCKQLQRRALVASTTVALQKLDANQSQWQSGERSHSAAGCHGFFLPMVSQSCSSPHRRLRRRGTTATSTQSYRQSVSQSATTGMERGNQQCLPISEPRKKKNYVCMLPLGRIRMRMWYIGFQ